MSRNYQKELEKILSNPGVRGKSLLLHSCCAPCSSYVLEYLRDYFRITVLFYNPNLVDELEYEYRRDEQKRLIEIMAANYPIAYQDSDFEAEIFDEAMKGQEACPEGGERCYKCYGLRLSKAAREAVCLGMDYFGTTLTLSPLKNAAKINELGFGIANAGKAVQYLPSDFKKRGGYQRSVELSKQYSLYRQNFCGCKYSV